VSDVSGGQVAIGDRVVQIDAHGAAHVVINEGTAVTITRRRSPTMRPAPPFAGMVGRAQELARISTSLQQGRSVEVVGPSGIGKTVLLRAASNARLPESAHDGVIAVPAQIGVPESLNYVFDACYEGTRRMVPRREELASALAELHLLVVIDDPLLDRESLDQLRLSLPGSLLLLSAHEQRIYRDVDALMLSGLPEQDGVALIEAYVGRTLTERERSVGVRVCEVLHGTPLELVRFASLVRSETDGDLVSVARGFGVDAQPEDVLVAVQRSTTVDEDAVLAALAAFGAPVGASLVAAMSGRPDAGEVLVRLAERGLVGGDDLQGWRRRDQYAVPPEERQRAAVVLTLWIQRRTVVEEVAGELPAINSVLASSLRDQRWADVIALAAAAERPLALSSRWSAWETTLQSGLRAARSAGDTASARFFAHQLQVMQSAMAPPPSTPTPPPTPPPPVPPDDDGPVAPGRPWLKIIGGIIGVALLLVVVVVVVGLMVDGDDPPPPPPGAQTVGVEFGEVVVGGEQVQGLPLPVSGAEPPLDVTGQDGSFFYTLSEECAFDADSCVIEVIFVPVDVGLASSRVEVVDAFGDVVAVVEASGAGVDDEAFGEPNLVAFTLGDESGVLALGEPEQRTVRVWNEPADGVAPSEGSVLAVDVTGPAFLVDPGLPECDLLSDVALACDVGGLAPGSTQDFVVTLVAGDVGDVVLTTTMLSFDGVVGRSQVRVFSVTGNTDVTAITCTVPDLVGLPVDQAEKVAFEAGFFFDAFVVEDGTASGIVLSQDPRAGAEVDCESLVVVEFSGLA
jgi:energy-coupling factor transporter ATP-binding protein EcfA2